MGNNSNEKQNLEKENIQDEINAINKIQSSSTRIHVMPSLKGGNKSKVIARKLGILIIILSAISLIIFVFYLYFDKYKKEARKVEQDVNIVSEINEEDIKIPEKIVKRVVEYEQIEVDEIEIINNSQSDENKIADATSTNEEILDFNTSTTSEEIDNELSEDASTNTDEDLEIEEPTSIMVLDNDSDGLSNKEEIVLGSNPDFRDTDGDSFEDLKEVLTLNNVIGEGIISENENIKKYVNSTLNYSVFYPAIWSYNDSSANGSVIFKTIDNQVIQIISPANRDNLSIREWYSIEVSAKNIKQSQVINKNGWEGLKSEDNLNVYIAHPNIRNRIFVIFYTPGIKNRLDYINIFNMIVNSFKLEDRS